MKYPTPEELQACRLYGTGEAELCRKYDLTVMEMYDLQRYGGVRENTAEWAEDLRARLGGLSHA
jgi:hypothetical protein